jgi:hypothetical protein
VLAAINFDDKLSGGTEKPALPLKGGGGNILEEMSVRAGMVYLASAIIWANRANR